MRGLGIHLWPQSCGMLTFERLYDVTRTFSQSHLVRVPAFRSLTQQELGLLVMAPSIVIICMLLITRFDWEVVGLRRFEPHNATALLLYALVVRVVRLPVKCWI